MADLIQMDTDEEIDKYDEATLIASNPPPLAATRDKMAVYNPLNGRNDVLVPLSLGGYVKLGEEPVDRLAEVRKYADELQQMEQPFDMADYEAAGFTQKEVEDAGIIPQGQEPSIRTEPLREGEELRMRREGAAMVTPDDPTMREDLTRLTFENTEGDLRQIFEVLGIDRFTARKMAEGLWGNPESTRDLGLGIADFTPAGLFFGAQEGMRTFERGRNTGDPLTIGMGALEAGLSFLEALPLTAAGAKGLKASMPAMRNALTELGRRMNQPGDMPTTSSFGVGAIDDPVKQAKQAVLDNPGDEELLGEYTRLLKERSEARDAAAVARATARGDVAIAEPPTETKPGIIAFHGSGTDFDQFKLEKIGTGEGAQAFGYGLYFADSEDIANFYRQTVGDGFSIDNLSIGEVDLVKGGAYRDYSPGATPFGRGPYTPVNQLTAEDYALASALEDIFINEYDLYDLKKTTGAGEVQTPKSGDELKQTIVARLQETVDSKDPLDQKEEIDYLQNLILDIESGKAPIKFDTEQHGHTYKVNLSLNPEDMLDYDKPLSEQPENIQTAFKTVFYDYFIKGDADLEALFASPNDLSMQDMGLFDRSTGSQAYAELADRLGKAIRPVPLSANGTMMPTEAIASKALFKAGVPGIKYRAAGSRAANVADADAGRNYVIFDDKLISIMKKYGIVGPVAVSAMTSQKQEEI